MWRWRQNDHAASLLSEKMKCAEVRSSEKIRAAKKNRCTFVVRPAGLRVSGTVVMTGETSRVYFA